ncbi:MAG TPA: glutamate--cysteine ligase [Gammaproteobacteria bacterium]|nr:glutamate--cysteine ligase [Gammaproteobacteria bacterium]
MDSNMVSPISLTSDFGVLSLLEQTLQQKQSEIRDWFIAQWQKTPPPLYGSVDMRNAGFKIAPVDMNLYPAGFNNLNANFLAEVVAAAQKTISEFMPAAKKIILVPENHTRNLFYWENIKALLDILHRAGFEVRVGSLNQEISQPLNIEVPSGGKVLIEPLERVDDILKVDGFIPDFILLNNDLSEGIPSILVNAKTPIVPPAELGWHQRLKSGHFNYYAEVTQEFANLLGLDSWLFTPLFRHCGEIDFMRSEGIDCLMAHTQALLNDVQQKYDEYKVKQQPFAIVKADAGTHGMAVMTVRNTDELAQLNRKQRTTMAKMKGGAPVHRVIVQEGVYTFETFGPSAYVAEPVIYLWGKYVAGGFYRIHQQRGSDENLNAPGMHFESLPFAWSCCEWPREVVHPHQKHLYIYGLISQLSMLAAAREINQAVA